MGLEVETEDAIVAFLKESLGVSCLRLTPLRGGRNSRVFSAVVAAERQVVVKAYHRNPQDPRDRLAAEWGAFEFLKQQGVPWVPEPLARDEDAQIAAYEFISGNPPDLCAVHVSDIREATAVLGELYRMGRSLPPPRERFGPASEACFSLEAICQSVRKRIALLEECAQSAPELQRFLSSELLPFERQINQWCETEAGASGVSFTQTVPEHARTLSPSDFGFHNSIRREGGGLVFLDFEYFGWDDPAKTVVDFLLHPAMRLGEPLQQEFFESAMRAFEAVPGLVERMRLVYPLFGLKWCCILLNEFTRQHASRRVFSGSTPPEVALLEQKKVLQLEKARVMLCDIQNAYLRFP
jgi:hypothetical protein